MVRTPARTLFYDGHWLAPEWGYGHSSVPSLAHSHRSALDAAPPPKQDLRSLLLASGVDLATVSALLGHSSVSLTASTYARVMPSLERDAAERLGRLLGARPDAAAPMADEAPFDHLSDLLPGDS